MEVVAVVPEEALVVDLVVDLVPEEVRFPNAAVVPADVVVEVGLLVVEVDAVALVVAEAVVRVVLEPSADPLRLSLNLTDTKEYLLHAARKICS